MGNKNQDDRLQEAMELIETHHSDAFVEELKNSLSKVIDKTKQARLAVIETAVDLSDDEKIKFESFLKRIFNREVKIYYQVNPHLFGGYAIQVGDWKLDATLVYQLEQMKKTLITKTY